MKSILLEKSYTENGGKIVPRPFSKIPKLSITLDQLSKISGSLQVEGYRNKLKVSGRPLAFTSYEAFLKNIKRSGTSVSVTFPTWFLTKNYFVMFYSMAKFPSCLCFM